MELIEQLLLEKSRQELIDKSVAADKTKRYGTTRWDRRRHVAIFPTVKNYNKVDMNALFKGNLLNFIVPIHGDRDLGSTNDYSVEILFEGICDKLKEELKRNNYKLEYKIVYRAIVKAINSSDILVSCTCDDFKYRQAYHATRGQYNAGRPELRPAKITNPGDTQGAGCKHIMNVIGNLNWAMKLAACINNYIFYIKDNMPELFESIIWPAISGMSYEQGENAGYFGDLANTMSSDSEGIIDTANEYGRTRTRFGNKNEPEVEEPIEEPEEFDIIDSEGV